MTALLIVVSCLGSQWTVTRQVRSDKDIKQIIRNLAVGTLVEHKEDLTLDSVKKLLERAHGERLIHNPAIYLNGKQTNLKDPKLWLAAANILATDEGEDVIYYHYDVYYKGMAIRRHTTIWQNHVRLVTVVTGNIGDLDKAVITINAVQRQNGTAITNSLWAHTPRGDRCRLVNRIALGIMRPLMRDAMNRAVGRALYLSQQGEQTGLKEMVEDLIENLHKGLRQ